MKSKRKKKKMKLRWVWKEWRAKKRGRSFEGGARRTGGRNYFESGWTSEF